MIGGSAKQIRVASLALICHLAQSRNNEERGDLAVVDFVRQIFAPTACSETLSANWRTLWRAKVVFSRFGTQKRLKKVADITVSD